MPILETNLGLHDQLAIATKQMLVHWYLAEVTFDQLTFDQSDCMASSIALTW